MQAFKVALSVLALVVLSAAGITSFGDFTVPPMVSELLAAGGVLFAWLGYQPIAVPPQVSRICAALSVAVAGFVTSHAAAWGDGGKHHWVVILSFLAAILGTVARGVATRAPEVPAGATLPTPR